MAMSRMISTDPFSRQKLHREIIQVGGETCDWCGSTPSQGKLYHYFTETDGGRRFDHRRLFCCKDCADAYHGN